MQIAAYPSIVHISYNDIPQELIENEKQIESFLQRNSEYELVEERKISAAESGYDGFYMAKLMRK